MISSRHNELRADRERLNQTAWDKGSYHVHDDRDGTGTRPQRVNNNSPQTGMEAGESHTVVSKGRGRGSNQNVRQRRKRPEMQIYVPRAKRLQQRGENNPTQNVESSANDHNPEDCTRSQNRSASLVTNRVGSEINIERRSLSPQSIGRGRAKPRDRHESKHEQSLKKLRKDNSDSELTSLNRIASTSDPLHDPQTKNVSGTEVHCHENQHVGEVKCEALSILERKNKLCTDAVSLKDSSSNTLISGQQIVPPNPPSVKNDSHKSFQDDGVHSEDCFYDAVVETSIISKCEGAKTAGLLQLEDEEESSDLHSNLSSDSERTKSTNQSDTERQTTVQLNSETKIEACLGEDIEVETSQSFDEDASSCPKQHQSTLESSENLDIQVKNKSQGETDNDDHPLLTECEQSFEVMSEEIVKGDSQERVSSVGSSDCYTYRQVDSSLVKEVPENVNDNQNHSVALENQNSSSISGITDSDMHLDNRQGDTKVFVLKDSNELMPERPEASLHSDGPKRSTTEMEDSGAEHLSGNTDFDKQTTEISAEPVPFSDTIIQPIEDTQNTTYEETMQKDCSNLVSSEMALNINEIEEEINKNPEGEVQFDSSVEKAAKTEILDEPLMKKLGEDSVDVCVEGEAMETDEGEEESWDKLFTEDGDCLDPKIMEELTAAVGSVQVEKPQAQNYYKYQPKSTDLDFEAYDHVLEISEFPAEFLTRDLISAFQSFMSRGFDIKWVDDTHALGIFSSSIAANEALSMQHPLLKVKPLSEADRQSKVKAKRSVEFLQPYKPRPETSASAARRLVTGALGLAPRVSREKREQERQQMRDAKARRKQDKKNKEDAWEGNYGKCAMDEDS